MVEIGRASGIRPRVALRVNPDFQIKGSGMRMGGGSQQFGVDAEQVPALLKELARAEVEFLGFHVFAGSQNLRADILAEAQRKTVELVLRLAEAAPSPVRYLNLGGGFGIPYFEKDAPLDLTAIGANLALLETKIRVQFARGSCGRRAWPVHRRRMRRLCHPHRRPQAIARARPSWSSTVASTTSSPRPAISAR